jgi:CRAL/TRIO domain
MCVTTATKTTAAEGDEQLVIRRGEETNTTPCGKSPVLDIINIGNGNDDHPSPWSDENLALVARLWDLTEQETRDLKELGRRLLQKKKSASTSSSSNNGDQQNKNSIENGSDNDDDESWEFVANHSKTVPLQVVRFLRARPGNVDAAEIMFRNMIAWRRQNKVDSILHDYTPPDEIVQHFPGAILQGLDKQGDPIFLSRTGVTDGAGLVQKYGREEMIRHAIWLRELVSRGEWLEECEQQQQQQKDNHNNSDGGGDDDDDDQPVNNKLQGQQQQQPRLPMRRMTLIDDLEGLSVFQIVKNRPLLNVYHEVMQLDQNNYPETCKKLLIIRAPALFRMVWMVIKHFFDPGVIQKMVFCSPANYRQVLQEHIHDLKILPSCIVPEGEGAARKGMPCNFQGGRLVPGGGVVQQEDNDGY